ncbi:MAG: NAD(P)/FAD-dependent oxidoreductase, partial [Bacteroidales bacterium]|nr:NAD(P)/FAD-dependent oxidoreductase [Bacteroidales bacterium]
HVKKWENTTVGHRGEEYEKWKEECSETLLDMIEEMFPNIRDCILEINTASPLTIRDYYGVKEGSMCGFSKDWKNITASQVPVVTKVKNLLMTGQNCNGHGFCGVPLTAINTCEVILGRNYVLDRINNKY